MKALLTCWLTAIAVLVWLALQPITFDKRWPTALPPAISLQTFNTARKAAARPSFCAYPLPKCRVG